jgi:ligand-binding sensor domain-containing protein
MNTRQILTLILVALLWQTSANAQLLNFRRVNEGLPTNVQAIAANQTSFYAALAGEGIYRSADNGATWQECVQFSNFNLQTLIATSFGAIAIGYDDDLLQMQMIRIVGTETEFISSFTAIGTTIRNIIERQNALYIAADNGFGVSRDYGQTWDSTAFPDGAILSTLTETASGLWIATSQGGILTLNPTAPSPNWTQLTISNLASVLAPSSFITAMTNIGNDLLALTSEGSVIRSAGSNSPWERLNTGFPANARIRSITAFGTTLLTLVSIGSGQSVEQRLYQFSNGAWNLHSLQVQSESQIAANAQSALCILPRTGLVRLAVGSSAWQETSHQGLPKNTAVKAFAASGRLLWLASEQGGIYQSSDNGASWRAQSTGLSAEHPIVSLIATPAGMFAGTATGRIFRMEQNGSIWQNLSGFTGNSGSVDVLFAHGTTLLAGVSNGGIAVSRDNGATWQQTETQVGTVIGAAALGSAIFVATSRKGVLRSTDGGATWQSWNTGLTAVQNVFGIQGIGVIGGKVCVGVEYPSLGFSATFQSDAATTAGWQQLNNIPLSKVGTVSEGNDSLMFTATTKGAIFRLTNQQWLEAAQYQDVQSLAVSNDIVFAGTNQGLFLSPSSAVITSVSSSFAAPLPAHLYPNPSTKGQMVHIRLANTPTEPVNIRIVDVLGKTVALVNSTSAHGVSVSGSVAIQVPEDMPEGAYMLRVEAKGRVLTTSRLIIR